MRKLTENSVLVTGSTDGASRLVARRLGEAGAWVTIHGRMEIRACIVADLERAGGTATFFGADLASQAEVRRITGSISWSADIIPTGPLH
jgi:NAD(P)-dependent dehydrogenase (short-subunit alcohol dehydrogenase family)